jgi:ribulose-phosphate 3-epimerase
MDRLDIVLLMSVNPGFGGQKLHPGNPQQAARRPRQARCLPGKNRPAHPLEIDGGVKVDNIAEIARAGADTFVAGSAVFGAGQATPMPHRYDSVIAALRGELVRS